MRATLFLLSSIALGCSSSTTGFFADAAADGAGPSNNEAGAMDSARSDSAPRDTAVSDTGFVVDTGPAKDPPPVTCDVPLPSFTCTPSDAKAGSTVCTDAMISEFVTGCFGSSGSSTACNAAMTKYPACNTCILTTWLYESTVDSGACVRKIDPTNKCGTAWRCNFDCLAEVCVGCDPTSGTGASGTESEYDDCEKEAQFAGSSTAAKGACYDVASRDLAACSLDPRFKYCFPRTSADVVNFFRGACRDGGNWTSAGTARP